MTRKPELEQTAEGIKAKLRKILAGYIPPLTREDIGVIIADAFKE